MVWLDVWSMSQSREEASPGSDPHRGAVQQLTAGRAAAAVSLWRSFRESPDAFDQPAEAALSLLAASLRLQRFDPSTVDRATADEVNRVVRSDAAVLASTMVSGLRDSDFDVRSLAEAIERESDVVVDDADADAVADALQVLVNLIDDLSLACLAVERLRADSGLEPVLSERFAAVRGWAAEGERLIADSPDLFLPIGRWAAFVSASFRDDLDEDLPLLRATGKYQRIVEALEGAHPLQRLRSVPTAEVLEPLVHFRTFCLQEARKRRAQAAARVPAGNPKRMMAAATERIGSEPLFRPAAKRRPLVVVMPQSLPDTDPAAGILRLDLAWYDATLFCVITTPANVLADHDAATEVEVSVESEASVPLSSSTTPDAANAEHRALLAFYAAMQGDQAGIVCQAWSVSPDASAVVEQGGVLRVRRGRADLTFAVPSLIDASDRHGEVTQLLSLVQATGNRQNVARAMRAIGAVSFDRQRTTSMTAAFYAFWAATVEFATRGDGQADPLLLPEDIRRLRDALASRDWPATFLAWLAQRAV